MEIEQAWKVLQDRMELGTDVGITTVEAALLTGIETRGMQTKMKKSMQTSMEVCMQICMGTSDGTVPRMETGIIDGHDDVD